MSTNLPRTTEIEITLKTRRRALIHHYLCAFVGRADEFKRTTNGRVCPKCHRLLQKNKHDWEVFDH